MDWNEFVKEISNMDWNEFVKALGDYHGIECGQVETMEEADGQLAEMYSQELPTNGKLITGAEWAEYQRLKAQKPTAPASLEERLINEILATATEITEETTGETMPVIFPTNVIAVISRYTKDGK